MWGQTVRFRLSGFGLKHDNTTAEQPILADGQSPMADSL